MEPRARTEWPSPYSPLPAERRNRLEACPRPDVLAAGSIPDPEFRWNGYVSVREEEAMVRAVYGARFCH